MFKFRSKEEIEREAIEEIKSRWEAERKILTPIIEPPKEPENLPIIYKPEKNFFKRILEKFKNKKEEQISKEQLELYSLKEEAKEQINKIINNKKDYEFLSNLNRIFRIFLRERWQISRTLTYEELVWNDKLQFVPEEFKDKILGIIIELNDFLYGKRNITENYSEEITNKILEVIENS